MGFARSIARASAGPLSGVATPERWVEEWFRGDMHNSAGVRVDYDTAMQYSSFFAGVRVISEDVAGLPLPLYERLERGKRKAKAHPLYDLLRWQPNPMMSSVQLRETLQGHALMWGNGVAQLVTNERTGVVEEIWPLRPDRLEIRVVRSGAGQLERWYIYSDHVNDIYAVLPSWQVLHIAGLGFDGVKGYSVVEHAANSIGLGLATEHHGAKFFSNGSAPGGALSHPQTLSDGARRRMQADWENIHKGIDRSHRVAILEEGVTWQQVGVPNDAAQYLETRKLQVTEMARWLRLPAHKINDLERATFSNIEQQQLDYVTTALRIWLERWEQAIYTQLLTTAERQTYFAEHLVDGLLQGDTVNRYSAYATARQWGWLSADDIRELENMNPLPNGAGETYLQPMNMIPALSPNESPDDEDEGRSAITARRARSSGQRRRIAENYKPKIAAADRKMAKRQRTRVRELARGHLRSATLRSEGTFLAAITELFEGEFLDGLIELLMPVLGELAGEVAAAAAVEVGGDDAEPPDLAAWIAAYVASHARYQVASAAGQIGAAIDGAEDDEAAAEAVEELLDEWVEERPERTARWEATQMGQAAARETWRDAGVSTLRWVTVGTDCPFCDRMDGTEVSIEEPFVPAGGEVTGLETNLQIDRDTFHPPIHPGCDCEVVNA